MLSYPSQRGASTTWLSGCSPSLLYVVILLPTRGFYNYISINGKDFQFLVVIPLPTRGFYNLQGVQGAKCQNRCHTPPNEGLLQLNIVIAIVSMVCCHTPPNEGLLQRRPLILLWNSFLTVVIPLPTRGFYNSLGLMELAYSAFLIDRRKSPAK